MISFCVSASPPGDKVKQGAGIEQTITDQVNIQPEVVVFSCENSVALPYIGNVVIPAAVPAEAEILVYKICSPVYLCACYNSGYYRKLTFLRFGGATSN